VKTYFAKRLIAISDSISTGIFMASHEASAWDEKAKANVKKALSRIIEECNFMGLKMTAIYAEKCLQKVDSSKSEEWSLKVDTLEERFCDEIRDITFFFIPQDKLNYYQKTDLFGTAVMENFPAANHEASEAGKCFATARYTACVFHLMRVLEIAMHSISKALEIPNPTRDAERNWGKMLVKIKGQIGQNNSQKSNDVTWQNDNDFYEKTYAYLEGVRNPWRNATMHVETDYDEGGALDIFNATSALMRHIAAKLTE
jgi:hypothetical protein